ncbi:MAG: MFS transporter [Prevotella sp.]|nr:MFS transporter [Prevotella sp.]MBQ3827213.1 MFS transporter [Prevotella sp.]MBQ7716169.1 MFS transporter [Prevotella sp.]
MKAREISNIGAVLFSFFVMGFCDIVGISSDYAREAFGWSQGMAGLLPSMVFVWFLFLSVPVGIKMNKWGRKNTVLLGMVVTIVGMMIPLIGTSWSCLIGYAALGIGNAILQVSENPLIKNVVTDEKILTSSLTAGQVVKAVSSFCGPFVMLLAVNVFGGGDKHYWYLAFPILGFITLLSALWLILSPIEREPIEKTNVTVGETFALLKNPTILLLFFGIFFAVAIDVGTNFVSSKIMINRYGWSVAEAGMAPQVYFICRTIGAFLGVFLMTKVSDMVYYRWNIITCIVVIVSLAFIQLPETWALAQIGAIGFLCSCIFPIIYSMAVQAEPDKANLISGLMITAVAGGGAATPFIGFATDAAGTITAGVCVLLLCAGYLTYCAFGIRVNH